MGVRGLRSAAALTGERARVLPAPGLHQHFFDGVPVAGAPLVGADNRLFAEVLLDAANLPNQLMLQFSDGSWEHRAYWGESRIAVGVPGSSSLRYMGPVPPPGEWVRLEVPARFVGMGERPLTGWAFTLWGGGATWGAAGTRAPNWLERLTRVPVLLGRTGISYVELVELLGTRFLNRSLPDDLARAWFERIPLSYDALAGLVGDGFANVDAATQGQLDAAGISVVELSAWAGEHFAALGKLLVLEAPESSCDLELTTLRHLDRSLPDEHDLTRLHRFIRLRLALGWSVVDLDRALSTFEAEDVTPALLRRLSQTVQLQTSLGLAPQKLLSLWGALPTAGEDALYRKLFLNRAVRVLDPVVFEPVAGEYLPAAAGRHIRDSVPRLARGPAAAGAGSRSHPRGCADRP